MGMFEKYVGNKVKCVHLDDAKTFWFIGVLTSEDDDFFMFKDVDGWRKVSVRKVNVIRLEEVN